jgi:hypothetical protein
MGTAVADWAAIQAEGEEDNGDGGAGDGAAGGGRRLTEITEELVSKMVYE